MQNLVLETLIHLGVSKCEATLVKCKIVYMFTIKRKKEKIIIKNLNYN
jgi:hypothetical protein